MAKPGKTHINLTTPGEYDFLTSVRFENDQSVSLRLVEIRLKDQMQQKPYKLPHNLLTWFTEHAPAGREITRDDNKQAKIANLYIKISDLKEQIETFALKSPFFMEVIVAELDDNDEVLVRPDNGMKLLEVNLYEGPKTRCKLKLSSRLKEAEPFKFPQNLGPNSHLELANITLQADEGPLDPRTDKRLLIASLKLEEPYEQFQSALIERLTLYNEQGAKPQQYIHDRHQYEEIYQAHPFGQNISFPNGAQIFGTFLPQGPKEKVKPLTVALAIPLSDPFWKELREKQTITQKNLKGTLSVILPEPGENKQQIIPINFEMDQKPWLLLCDVKAENTPIKIPLANMKEGKDHKLVLPTPLSSAKESEFIFIEHYPGISLQGKEGSNKKAPISVAFNPKNKETSSHSFRPEIIELTGGEQLYLLLNKAVATKDKKSKQAEFRLKCFWTESQENVSHNLSISWQKPVENTGFAIDIGSYSISLTSQVAGFIEPVALGKFTNPMSSISDFCIPSSLSLSIGAESSDEEQKHQSSLMNRRAISSPLSLSYKNLPWQKEGLKSRILMHQRSYDISVPALTRETSATTIQDQEQPLYQTTVMNLKRLFSKGQLNASLKENEFFIAQNKNENDELTGEVGLAKQVSTNHLMTDCLSELINYYGTYLARLDGNVAQTTETKNTFLNAIGPTDLVMTHPDHFFHSSKLAYQTAAARALSLYEQGSFANLGSVRELIGLKDQETVRENVHLINESAAAAFSLLTKFAEQQQLPRSKKLKQIHLDIGVKALSVTAFTGVIGETNCLLKEQHGAIHLNLGGCILELMLIKEIASIIETALNADVPLTPEAPLPMKLDRIKAIETPKNEAEEMGLQFLENVRIAIKNSSAILHQKNTNTKQKQQSTNDLRICLAQNNEEPWPFSLATTIAISDDPITLWQGLNGEKIILSFSENKSDWKCELHCSSHMIAEKVGPLSTYLGFVTSFLPKVIEQCFPQDLIDLDCFFSVSGGTSLFPVLQQHLSNTAKKRKAKAFIKPGDYDEAKLSVASGALALINNQKRPPITRPSPNLILSPLSAEQEPAENLYEIASRGSIAVIKDKNAEAVIPPSCVSLQLVETIPGLGSLLKADPNALLCQTYLEDLDHASKNQWAVAETQWYSWLKDCYQTMLLMAVPEQQTGTDMQEQKWRFKALQQHEAELTIGEQTYWISSALTSSDD